MKQNFQAINFSKNKRSNSFFYPDDLEILETWNQNSSVQYFRRRQDRKTNSLVLFLGEVTARQICFEIYWPLLMSDRNEKFLILNLWVDLCDNHFDWSKKLCQILLPNSRHPFYDCINLGLILISGIIWKNKYDIKKNTKISLTNSY